MKNKNRLDLGSVIFVHPECTDKKFSYCHSHCYHEPRVTAKRARYPGNCKRCGKPISVNNDIELLGSHWVHLGCEAATVLSEQNLEDMARKALIKPEEEQRSSSPLSFLNVREIVSVYRFNVCFNF